MISIINAKDYSEGIEAAAVYYHSKWGNESNYAFFKDAFIHSTNVKQGLPRFYLAVKQNTIIGCCGLITNDFISRVDLYPWLAGLFIDEQERGQALGSKLIQFAENDARKTGHHSLYLTTDHDGYYEKYGWTRIDDGYDPGGNPARIYQKKL